MKKIFYIIILISFSRLVISQTFDTTKLKSLNAAYHNGDLKMPELNPDDFVLEKEKVLKLNKCTFDKTCLFNYKGFVFHFDYNAFMTAVTANPLKNFSSSLTTQKDHIFKDNTIHINYYMKKASDENFVIAYVRQMAEEKKLNVFDSSGQQIERFTLRKGIKETKTNRSEITFFYLIGSYVFHSNDRLCTSKRFDD